MNQNVDKYKLLNGYLQLFKIKNKSFLWKNLIKLKRKYEGTLSLRV